MATMHEPKEEKTKKMIVPTEVDILYGRNAESWNNVGNQRLRKVIAKYEDVYHLVDTSRKERIKIVANILDEVKAYGGRFLKRDARDTCWREVDRKTAVDKVGHAIRDKCGIAMRRLRRRVNRLTRGVQRQQQREKSKEIPGVHSVSLTFPDKSPSPLAATISDHGFLTNGLVKEGKMALVRHISRMLPSVNMPTGVPSSLVPSVSGLSIEVEYMDAMTRVHPSMSSELLDNGITSSLINQRRFQDQIGMTMRPARFNASNPLDLAVKQFLRRQNHSFNLEEERAVLRQSQLQPIASQSIDAFLLSRMGSFTYTSTSDIANGLAYLDPRIRNSLPAHLTSATCDKAAPISIPHGEWRYMQSPRISCSVADSSSSYCTQVVSHSPDKT